MARKTKFTPGPWRARGVDQGITIIPDGGDDLATPIAVVGWRGEHGEPTANARLIAVAPDLASIAQRIEQWDRDCSAVIDRAALRDLNAIIADARGTLRKAEIPVEGGEI